ncbi:MAG: hypothetical protein VW827_02025 [Alphaproteobacteria bacterium]
MNTEIITKKFTEGKILTIINDISEKVSPELYTDSGLNFLSISDKLSIIAE